MAEDKGTLLAERPELTRPAQERGGVPGSRQGGPGQGSPGAQRHVRASPGPTRPRVAAPGAGEEQGAGAGAHPLRPDARLPLHLLPGRRPHHGLGPLDHAVLGPDGPALRGRPSLQLRGVRDAGAAAHLRLQRLRRDASRAVGVGRQAAGGERRDRRPHQGPPQGRAGPGDRRPGADVPGVDAPDGDAVEPGGLVLPRGRIGGRGIAGVPGGHLGLEETGADGGDGDASWWPRRTRRTAIGHSTS